MAVPVLRESGDETTREDGETETGWGQGKDRGDRDGRRRAETSGSPALERGSRMAALCAS